MTPPVGGNTSLKGIHGMNDTTTSATESAPVTPNSVTADAPKGNVVSQVVKEFMENREKEISEEAPKEPEKKAAEKPQAKEQEAEVEAESEVEEAEVEDVSAEQPEFTREELLWAARHGKSRNDLERLRDLNLLDVLVPSNEPKKADGDSKPVAEAPNPGDSQKKTTIEVPEDLLFNEEEFDPEVATIIKKLTARTLQLEKQLAESRKPLDEISAWRSQIDGEIQARQKAEQIRFIDGLFDKVGEEFKGVFGTKKIGELDKESAEFKSRLDVLEIADTIVTGYQQRNKPITYEQAFEAALNMRFPNRKAQAEVVKIRERANDGIKKLHTLKPTGRSPIPAATKESARNQSESIQNTVVDELKRIRGTA